MTKLRSLVTFYKSFAYSSSVITLTCMVLIFLYGLETFKVLFWFKIATLGLIFLVINNYKKKEFYYFYNLGISKLFLWASTLLFDFFLFLVLFFITLNIR